jgi:anti-sigma factor RsiW
MLRCREVAELASDYVNGDLSRSRRLAVRLHLAICRACRRYLRQMRETVALLRALSREPVERDEASARALFRASHRK